MTTCKACGAVLCWRINEKTGAKIPLVLVPKENPPEKPVRFTIVSGTYCRRDDDGIYLSHFQNCPKAKDFSGRSKRV